VPGLTAPVAAAPAPVAAAVAVDVQGAPAEEAERPLVAADLAGMAWRALQQLCSALGVYRAGMRRVDLEAAILVADAVQRAVAPAAAHAPAPAAAAPAAAPAAAAPAAAAPVPAVAAAAPQVDDLLCALIARLDRLEAAAPTGAAPAATVPAPSVLPPELAAERQYPARVLRAPRDQHELDAHLAVARLMWRAQQCVDADEA